MITRAHVLAGLDGFFEGVVAPVAPAARERARETIQRMRTESPTQTPYFFVAGGLGLGAHLYGVGEAADWQPHTLLIAAGIYVAGNGLQYIGNRIFDRLHDS